MKKILLPVLGSVLLCFAIQHHVAAKPKGDKTTETAHLLEQKEDGSTKYEEVFTYDSVSISQETAYKRAKEFVVSTLKTADNNIISEDPTFTQLINNGNILLKSSSSFGFSVTNTSFDFKLKVSFKPGRYKIVIDNVIYHAVYNTSNRVMPVTEAYERLRDNKAANKVKDEIDQNLTSLVTSLNKAIKNKDAESKSNW
jgi:hypothetical protein